MGCNCASNAKPQKWIANLKDGTQATYTTEADLRLAIARGQVSTWSKQDA